MLMILAENATPITWASAFMTIGVVAAFGFFGCLLLWILNDCPWPGRN